MTRRENSSMGWRMRCGILVAVASALAGTSLPAKAAVAPSLGAARSFAALGGSTLTNTGATTVVVGDVGVSPGSAIVGFGPGQVTGGTYVGGDAPADQAHSDAALAYAFLAGMATVPANNLTSVDMGGLTLAPGVYYFNSSAGLTGNLTLDAGGDSAAVFVFKIATSLTTAPGSSVIVINGGADYDESNVFWQVGSSATIDTGNAFIGNIIADQAVTLKTGTSLIGSALAINAACSLDSNAVTSPPVQTPPIVAIQPPTDLTAVLSGPTAGPEADLAWTDASDNETEFRVYRREGAGPDFVLVGTVLTTDMAGTGGVFNFVDTPLVPETTYTYRVTAFALPVGESDPSNEALVDTVVEVPLVAAPINLVAVLSGDASAPGADLSWNDASDNETEFRVYRRDDAGPGFALVGTVLSTDMAGTEGTVLFHDPILDPAMTLTYRVTAFNATDGESEPSNEALIQTGGLPPARFLDLQMGRRRSFIRDHKRSNGDRMVLRGSFSLIDVTSSVPVVMHDLDPRAEGVTIQVRAPGSIIVITVAADDPNWKVSKSGVYTWRSRDGSGSPATYIMIDNRKSEFRVMTRKNEFGAINPAAVTVTLDCGGASGSETRTWKRKKELWDGTRARYTLAK